MKNLGDLPNESVHSEGHDPSKGIGSLNSTGAFMMDLSVYSGSGSIDANTDYSLLVADSHRDDTSGGTDHPSHYNSNGSIIINNHSSNPDTEPGPQQQSKRKLLAEGRTYGNRVGRWSLDEKILFLYGLREFGKGRWKKISVYLPDRSLVQIKSHAQKVLKRLDAGENVFRRLEENGGRLQMLLSQAHGEHLGLEGVQPQPFHPRPFRTPAIGSTTTASTFNNTSASTFNNTPSAWSSAVCQTRRKDHDTTTVQSQPSNHAVIGMRPSTQPHGKDHDILAASALCQLAGPAQQEETGTTPRAEPPQSPQQQQRQASSPVIVLVEM